MIGANAAVIEKAEARDQFKKAMERIGLEVLPRRDRHNLDEARRAVAAISACPAWSGPASRSAAPARASPTTGTNSMPVAHGLDASPIHQVLLEESVIGWKEYEMEAMRDARRHRRHHLLDRKLRSDGRHTGDSITVAPATLHKG